MPGCRTATLVRHCRDSLSNTANEERRCSFDAGTKYLFLFAVSVNSVRPAGASATSANVSACVLEDACGVERASAESTVTAKHAQGEGMGISYAPLTS